MVAELIPLDWISIVKQYGPAGLFIWNFLSVSIVPLTNEVPIAAATAFLDPFTIFVFSTIGTWLGGLTNYYSGSKGVHNWLVKRDPKTEKRAQEFFKKWGEVLYLIIPYLPFIGDPI